MEVSWFRKTTDDRRRTKAGIPPVEDELWFQTVAAIVKPLG
jgi:hypothetical protein